MARSSNETHTPYEVNRRASIGRRYYSDSRISSGLWQEGTLQSALTSFLRGACALSFALSTPLAAQSSTLPLAHWQHTAWTGAAGPPVPGSHYLRQSPDGYLWLSANNSIIRFDGVRFTVFDSSNSAALRSKEPGEWTPLLVDRKGAMWISGPGGERVTYQKGSFHRHFTLETGSGPVGEDDTGLIWLKGGTPQRYVDGKLVPLPLPDSMPSSMWSMITDTGRGHWVGSRKEGVWHIAASGAVRRYGSGEARPMLQQRDGTLWVVGTGPGGIARLDGSEWKPLLLPGDTNRIHGRFAYEGADGSAWFQTNVRGLLRYRNGVVEAFGTADGLSDPRVNDIAFDSSGVVWVSTDAGLDRLRPAAFAALDPARRLPSNGVSVYVTQDRSGSIWLKTLNSDTVLLVDGGIIRSEPGPLRIRSMGTGRIMGPGAHGGVWLKTLNGNLVHLGTNGATRIVGAREGLATLRINGVLESSDGALWIESTGGLGLLRQGRYRNVVIDGDSAIVANAYALDRRGHFWLAWNDLPQVATFASDSIVRRVAVPLDHVDYLAVEGADTVWAASEYGVARIIGDSAVVVPVPGLERALVARLTLAVTQGALWITSYGGIVRLNLAELHAAADGGGAAVRPQFFDRLDGLPAPTVSRIEWRSSWVGADGRLWVNTASGVAVTNPDYHPDRIAPLLLTERIRANGRQVGDSFPMPTRPKRVEIEFTATGAQLPERLRLQYQLAGADSTWLDAPASRVASYDGLAHGHYLFKLRGWNGDGIPTPEQAVLGFQISPAWNQAWWFFTLLMLSIAGLAGGMAVLWQRRRHERAVARERAEFDRLLLERKKHYEATLAERARIAQDLHDTLLQGFAGVTLQLKAAELALPDSPGVAAETILRTQQLARDSLREARERVWEMKDSTLGGEDLPGALERLATERASGTGIAVTLRVDGVRRRLSHAVEDTAFRVGREAVINAIRHSSAHRIDLTVEFSDNSLRLGISDDGVGFEPKQADEAHRQGHFGVSGMHDRAVQMGGRVEITRQLEGGTRVTLDLPVMDSVKQD